MLNDMINQMNISMCIDVHVIVHISPTNNTLEIISLRTGKQVMDRFIRGSFIKRGVYHS